MAATCFFTDFRPLSASIEEGARLLSPDRAQRVLRCRRPQSALGFLGAGLLLRYVLGALDGDLRFEPSGKPYLPGGPCFNLSHGGHYAVLAVDGAPLGADIEPLGRFDRRVAGRCFTPAELRWAGDRDEALYTLWTLKESVLKAHGSGLSFAALRGFCVMPELTGRVPGGSWALHTRLLDGHALSLALSGEDGFVLTRVEAPALLNPKSHPERNSFL